MANFIQVGPYPEPQALRLLDDSGTVITASRLAARALGVPHQSLSSLASKHLAQQGWAIASTLKAQSIFRQVLQETVQPADLLGTANAWLPTVRSLLQSSPNLGNVSGTFSERTHQLLHVAQAFQQALHGENLVDLSELYWRAIEHFPEPQKVLIYGYFQPRLDELAWMNAIAASDSALFLPAPDAPLFQDVQRSVEWLVEQGWEVVAEAIDTEAIGGHLSQVFIGNRSRGSEDAPLKLTHSTQNPSFSVKAHRYSTFEAEMRGTLAQVKALLNAGTPARDIAIIARDEVAYGPQLIDIAWEYGVPLRALYDTPLLSTRLGSWLKLLIEVMDTGWPFEATAKLLSHPLCSNPDKNFWATVRVEHPVGFAAWQAIAQEHLDLDLTALASIKRDRKPDTWVNWWYDLFRTFDLRKRCARWSRESIAFNNLYRGLVELAKLGEEPKSWADFRQELIDLLQVLTVPAQPGRGGVELHKPTSVVGAQYDHLFVLGMAEGGLPATISNDPVLDFFERQQLQRQGLALPTAAAMARREALSFYALLQTATGNLTFSYAELKDRQEQLLSPYLKQLDLKPGEPPMRAIASPEELRRASLRHSGDHEDTVLPYARHAFTVEQYRESSAAPNEYDGIVGMPLDYTDRVFSASQLRNLGQCPFKWFADKLLKLGPTEEVDEDLSPSQIGQLYHKVLELVLAAKQQQPELDITDAQLLEEKFAIAERQIIPADLPSWSLRRSEHLRCLTLALADPNFLPEGTEPLQLEGNFSGEWHGLKVRGQVDRIDRTEHGLVLIDYKTGKSRPPGIKDINGRVEIDVQLALYEEAAGPDLFPDEPIANAYYYSIRGRKQISKPKPNIQAQLPDALDRCKAHLDQGHYPVQPDNGRSACTYCDFDALCRQGDRLSRKNPHPPTPSPTTGY
ncbi:PD-(D/E)XK nuclease family protein [Halomicronema sp. CCY15110]|uniref:PD-(D/E)XK nuclease family protein n=1 Tax=Halomicronema sp. CCY15110 TaxID=2767773 RepID=UPI00194FB637|nr:PD-(D/E)XK nuclease family protein [Halomicronema sp. CCY15110]